MHFKRTITQIIFSTILTFIFILPVSAADFSSAPDLEVGQTNPFVIQLQKLLNSNGYVINPTAGQPGSIGHETDYFGKMTQSALSKFQSTFGLSPNAGYFGPKTKAKVTELTDNGTLNGEVAVIKTGESNLANYGLQTCTQVSQYGITWTFSSPVSCGQFANGDWWVVGPVTITSITPLPVTTSDSENGSMINPLPRPPSYSGFKPHGDNPSQGLYRHTSQTYNANLNIGLPRNLPKTISTPASIVSTINNPNTWTPGVDLEKTWFKEVAILTVLPAVPQEGSFRPPYAGTDKTIKTNWNKSTLNSIGYSRLRSLQVPKSSNMPSWSSIEDALKRPILEMVPNHESSNWKASWALNKPGGYYRKTYGREIGHLSGTAGVMLNTNATNTQKEKALIYMVQWGIDNHGLIKNGLLWENAGGHGLGRLTPVFVAAKVLNDSDIMTSAREGYFAETSGHFFVGNDAINATITAPNKPYTESMRGIPEWTSGGSFDWTLKSSAFCDGTCVEGGKSWYGVPYRSNSGSASMGQVTTIMLMNGVLDITGGSQTSGRAAWLKYQTDRFYPMKRSGVQEGAVIDGTNGITALVRDMYDAHVLNDVLPPTTPPVDPPIDPPLTPTTFSPGNVVRTTAATTWVNTTRSVFTPIKSFGTGVTATVLDGPQDAENITWYRVRYTDGTEGYTGANVLTFVSTGTPPSTPALISPTITRVNGVTTNIKGTTSTISPAFPSNTNTVRIEWEDKDSNYLVRYKKTGGSEVQRDAYTREYFDIENISPGDTYTFWIHTGVIQGGQYSEPKSEVVFSIAQSGGVSTDDDSDGVSNTADRCPNTKAGQSVNLKGCPTPTLSAFDLKPDLSNTDLGAVTNFYVGKTGLGKIDWGSRTIDLQKTSGLVRERLDLNSIITIENKKVFVDSSVASQLNVPATITLYNITKAPKAIKKNGVEQPGLTFTYDAPAQTLTFTVPGFSEYGLIEDDESVPVINPPVITSPTNGSTIPSASTVTMTWTGDTSNYLVRVQNLTDPSKNTKNSNQNQEYENTWASKTITFDTVPGNEYKVWVHAGALGDGTYSVKDEITFTVGTSTVTPPADTGGSTGGSSGGGGGGGGGGGSSKKTAAKDALKVSCTIDQTTLGIGSVASVDTTIKNAATPYTLKWTGSMIKLKGFDKTKEDQKITFPKKGSYTLGLEVKDKNGKKAKATCKTVKVGTKYKTIAPAAAPTGSSAKTKTSSSTTSSTTFARDLAIGSRGADVKELQKYLNARGFLISTSGDGSLGKETDYFGPATANALSRYQTSRGLSPAAGFFGQATRGAVNGGK